LRKKTRLHPVQGTPSPHLFPKRFDNYFDFEIVKDFPKLKMKNIPIKKTERKEGT